MEDRAATQLRTATEQWFLGQVGQTLAVRTRYLALLSRFSSAVTTERT